MLSKVSVSKSGRLPPLSASNLGATSKSISASMTLGSQEGKLISKLQKDFAGKEQDLRSSAENPKGLDKSLNIKDAKPKRTFNTAGTKTGSNP